MAKNDMEEMTKFNSGNKEKRRAERFRCTNCGIINESSGGAPSHCIKCENTKFFKL